ncbi:(2Fe-2S)-binding protein [Alicyclobacillus fastidiosus]|uniref:(2Fe-2S)-binding protein n=1 Tax=Alicyclobacillus fastidiosus TaxID=392011 RepID=A0ABY6ZCN4_9BACL|nr:(2Fe-2S)-binding protein [Alicyclobacillus fastidiosus]WAH40495.1 (2Fe-2S)-binding protein [Alicyclobacillus fastidiosus]GMA61911.1 pyridine nucleotide-disulfide oxidoreductase [Alicyclobacillus fastidiosus]
MSTSSLLICRCEEVRVEDLEKAYANGAVTSRQLKMNTRATMGACQGRVCRHLVEAWVHEMNPLAPYTTENLSYRPPVRPMTFGELAKGE